MSGAGGEPHLARFGEHILHAWRVLHAGSYSCHYATKTEAETFPLAKVRPEKILEVNFSPCIFTCCVIFKEFPLSRC